MNCDKVTANQFLPKSLKKLMFSGKKLGISYGKIV